MGGEQVNQTHVARYDSSAWQNGVAALRRDGVVAIDRIFSSERIEQVLNALRFHYPEYFGQGVPDDYFEVGDCRFTAPLCYAPPFDCTDIVAHPVLSALLAEILTDEFVFEALGVISSLPGASDQHVHRDGGMLFSEIGIDRILPPSALSVIIPLVDMDSVNGSTAVWLGSHHGGKPDADAPFACPVIPAGSMIIWDYRVMHCGLANRGTSARPLIYLTACRPYWIDHRNFKSGKNAKLLASQAALEGLDEQTRKRFVRAERVK